MQAYVFWHRPRPGVAQPEYEAGLRRFHAQLATSGTPGFVTSSSVRLSLAPFTWPAPCGADDGTTTYEDWYLIDDAAALDTLEAAAVTAVQALHDAAAALAGAGSAGLYRLVAGVHDHRARFATWCDLPAGTPRRDWEAVLAAAAAGSPGSEEGALWVRRLTLGPAPEFCLLRATGGAGLPAAVEIERRLVT